MTETPSTSPLVSTPRADPLVVGIVQTFLSGNISPNIVTLSYVTASVDLKSSALISLFIDTVVAELSSSNKSVLLSKMKWSVAVINISVEAPVIVSRRTPIASGTKSVVRDFNKAASSSFITEDPVPVAVFKLVDATFVFPIIMSAVVSNDTPVVA